MSTRYMYIMIDSSIYDSSSCLCSPRPALSCSLVALSLSIFGGKNEVNSDPLQCIKIQKSPRDLTLIADVCESGYSDGLESHWPLAAQVRILSHPFLFASCMHLVFAI